MSKVSKSERIRLIGIAAELEVVQNMLVSAETELVSFATHLASITATMNKIICQIVEDGARPLP